MHLDAGRAPAQHHQREVDEFLRFRIHGAVSAARAHEACRTLPPLCRWTQHSAQQQRCLQAAGDSCGRSTDIFVHHDSFVECWMKRPVDMAGRRAGDLPDHRRQACRARPMPPSVGQDARGDGDEQAAGGLRIDAQLDEGFVDIAQRTVKSSPTYSILRSMAPGMTPSRSASSAPGRRAARRRTMRAVTPEWRHMLMRWPKRPKPVMSVQVVAPASRIASAAPLIQRRHRRLDGRHVAVRRGRSAGRNSARRRRAAW